MTSMTPSLGLKEAFKRLFSGGPRTFKKIDGVSQRPGRFDKKKPANAAYEKKSFNERGGDESSSFKSDKPFGRDRYDGPKGDFKSSASYNNNGAFSGLKNDYRPPRDGSFKKFDSIPKGDGNAANGRFDTRPPRGGGFVKNAESRDWKFEPKDMARKFEDRAPRDSFKRDQYRIESNMNNGKPRLPWSSPENNIDGFRKEPNRYGGEAVNFNKFDRKPRAVYDQSGNHDSNGKATFNRDFNGGRAPFKPRDFEEKASFKPDSYGKAPFKRDFNEKNRNGGFRKDRPSDNNLGRSRLVITKNSELNRIAQSANRAKLAQLGDIEGLTETAPNALRPSILEALEAMNIKKLNAVQEQTYLVALESPSVVLCASETGSGKTLAYLLPIIEKLKLEEEEVKSDEEARLPKSPRALVLVPSAELVQQVGSVAKLLSHHAKLRVGHLTRSMAMNSPSESFDRLFSPDSPLDLLITTPYQVIRGVEDGRFNLDSLRHLVVDEADSMIVDETFAPQLDKLLHLMPTSRTQQVQDQLDTLVLSSATISDSVKETISKWFPSVKTISSPELHKPLKSCRFDFHTIEGPGDARQRKLIDLLDKNAGGASLIFCNSSSNATALHSYLERHYMAQEKAESVPSLIHGYIPEQQRSTLLSHTRSSPSASTIICTDVLARGLDTTGWIRHVILYDFPHSLQQFLHRAGRAGRAGEKGRVSLLVGGKDRMMAEFIRQAVTRRLRLDQTLEEPTPIKADN